MFWPRFMYVVQLNIESIKSTDPQKLGVVDIRPHYVSICCGREGLLNSSAVLRPGAVD